MTTQQNKPIAVRVIHPDDLPELERLAGVDSAPVPAGSRLIGAEIDGRVVAAISLDDGSMIADPFQPTSAAVELLRLRASQLGGTIEAPARGGMRRVLAGLVRGHAHAGLAGSPPGAGGRLLQL